MRRKIKLIYYFIINKLYRIIHQKSFQYKIAIMTSSEYKNKFIGDLLLQNNLLHNQITSDILSWEEDNNYSKYDAILISSIWEYQDQIDKFTKWLQYLEDNDIKVYNSLDIIKNNYIKEKQIAILEKNNIKFIPTKVIEKKTKNLEKEISSIINEFNNQEIVIKPSISGSGNNTFIIGESNRQNSYLLKNIISKLERINKEYNLLIQPFIKEIDNGEISVIYIGNKPSHAILRYPKIFNNGGLTHQVPLSSLDKSLMELCNEIIKIKEYQENLYIRIDAVKIDNEYKLMEVELLEPDLFFYLINDKSERKIVLDNYSKELINRLNKIDKQK